jgi:hypothetical protein
MKSILPDLSERPLQAFWAGVAFLVVYLAFNVWNTPVAVLLAGILVVPCALLPVYLWCAGAVPGLPVFPLMSLTYLWTYCLPLFTQQGVVATYDVSAQLQAAITTILFLLTGTFAWWTVMRAPHHPPQEFLALRDSVAPKLFIFSLALCCLLQVALYGNWLPLPAGTFSIISSFSGSLSTVAVMVLAHRQGQRRLSDSEVKGFLTLLTIYLIITTTSLLLVNPMSVALIAIVSFTVGRGKVPVSACVLLVLICGFLHIGKHPMRNTYWRADRATLQPIEYPMFYVEWIGYSLEALPQFLIPSGERKGASLTERSSLLQMLLVVQTRSPGIVPFQNGDTYAIIPRLLVPRVIDPDKPWSHEGTYILAIAYGLQTREQTKTTTVGFGLLAESYANFGYFGVLLLGIVLGWFFAWSTRWCLNLPMTALRSMITLLILSLSFQSEVTAGVLVTTLAQSIAVMLLMSLLVMQRHAYRRPLPSARPSFSAPT